ncbi:hypothetical protein PybrP1_002806 [[Pythium] brassicae (nom. inval.)]|nr:hypothetical protein PybrP1_002806 [[Pythium] brassicae (nom. inval.)]
MAASAVSLQPLSGSSGSGLGGSLSSRVGNHKDYRIYRSTPLSEPLRGIPPLARPVDASYYTPVTTKSPSPPTSSTSSTSSSIFYRQRSESFENMLLAPSSRASFSYSSSSHSGKPVLEPETPFDAHLQAVYSGAYDMAEGLAFFESHGYYDVDDANTVAMFRQNFGLTDLFWDKNSAAAATADSAPVLVLDADSSDALGFPSVGTTLYRRHRSVSGRFELVDSDGNAVDDELERERAREARLKSLALELDEFDLRELAHEQAVLVHAISAIRSETLQFQQYFSEAFREADAATVVQCAPAPPVQHARHATLPSCATAVPMPAVAVAAAAPPPPSGVMTPSEVATAVASAASALSPPPQLAGLQQLPPYCGNVFLLKDTIPYLLRSWRKRWFYLDFNAGLLMMYKRSYWKSPRGVLDLRTVTKVERMNHSGDFRLEFHSAQQPVMLLRTKAAEEAELWVNLLRFAKHHVGATPAPQLVLDVAAGDMRAHVLLENKLKKQAGAAPRRASNKPANQGEMGAERSTGSIIQQFCER